MNNSASPGQRPGTDAITVRGLTKTYRLPKGGTLTAVDRLDLTIRAGETYALLVLGVWVAVGAVLARLAFKWPPQK